MGLKLSKLSKYNKINHDQKNNELVELDCNYKIYYNKKIINYEDIFLIAFHHYKLGKRSLFLSSYERIWNSLQYSYFENSTKYFIQIKEDRPKLINKQSDDFNYVSATDKYFTFNYKTNFYKIKLETSYNLEKYHLKNLISHDYFNVIDKLDSTNFTKTTFLINKIKFYVIIDINGYMRRTEKESLIHMAIHNYKMYIWNKKEISYLLLLANKYDNNSLFSGISKDSLKIIIHYLEE